MRKYWIILAIPVMLFACRNVFGKRITGNGNIRTEDRSVSSFKKVDVRGSSKVYVSQGDRSAVRIEADDNILKYIELIQEDDKVIIRNKPGFNLRPSGDINVFVTSPAYSSIEASGACDIIGKTKITNPEALSLDVSGAGDINMEVDAPSLKVEVSGSGKINMKGQTKDVSFDLNGAGHAHCFDLLAENVKVDITGAGSAEVYASVKLDAEVSGAGSVSYKGNASNVNQHVSGAGSVKKVD